MPTTITITMQGLPELQKRMAHGDAVVQNSVAKMLIAFGVSVEGKAKQAVPKDTGYLQSKITHAVELGRETSEVRIGTWVNYAAHVEFGTRPHMPPVEAMNPWARRHGTTPWAIAMHIAKYGTKPHPYLVPSFENTVETELPGLLAACGREIVGGLAQ